MTQPHIPFEALAEFDPRPVDEEALQMLADCEDYLALDRSHLLETHKPTFNNRFRRIASALCVGFARSAWQPYITGVYFNERDQD